jgi:hypothetical protein
MFLKESALLVLLARGYTLRISFVFFCSVLVLLLVLSCSNNKKRQANKHMQETEK